MTFATSPEPALPAPDEPPPTPGEPPASPAPGPSVTIDLSLHVHDSDPPLAGWLEPLLAQAVQLAGCKTCKLSLVIVGDGEMAQLHERWKNVPGTTDVLTFDLSEPDAPEDSVEGDVVLCLDEAKRQAEARAHTVRQEVLLYAVHGLLHLMGEDDQNPAAYERMHQREDDLLTRLGVGRVFDRGPDRPRTD